MPAILKRTLHKPRKVSIYFSRQHSQKAQVWPRMKKQSKKVCAENGIITSGSRTENLTLAREIWDSSGKSGIWGKNLDSRENTRFARKIWDIGCVGKTEDLPGLKHSHGKHRIPAENVAFALKI